MTADVPRKRTLGALLLFGASLGGAVGAIDHARGVPSSAAAIFSRNSAPLQSRGPGQPVAALVTSTAGAAAFIENDER